VLVFVIRRVIGQDRVHAVQRRWLDIRFAPRKRTSTLTSGTSTLARIGCAGISTSSKKAAVDLGGHARALARLRVSDTVARARELPRATLWKFLDFRAGLSGSKSVRLIYMTL
jgi:hypothetical protein